MKRLKDDFIKIIDIKSLLHNKVLLEIGCGTGLRSIQIAEKCLELNAIDPDKDAVKQAQELNNRYNVTYLIGSAEELRFKDNTFDTIIFTLSFHHVPQSHMRNAIEEAVRVTKPDGNVVFLEPTEVGTFFESELTFDACDGDEREAKSAAYKAMLEADDILESLEEIADKTVLEFESYDDFLEVMKPKTNLDKLTDFLLEHNFTLNAQRRINIFKVKKRH